MTTLIIGGESTIGTALAAHLVNSDIQVITTSRRAKPSGALFLNLADSKAVNALKIPDIDNCIILASVTSMQECENSNNQAYCINVRNTISLINKLERTGVFTVFPSSNQVFNEHSRYNPPDTTPQPSNRYGKMKLEVETHIKYHCSNTAILRMGKIIGIQFSVLEDFIKNVLQGNPVYPYDNYAISPVSMTLCCKVIAALLEQKCSGIFQLSATSSICYHKLVKNVCGILDIKTDLINPGSMTKEGIKTPINNPIMETNVDELIQLSCYDLSIDAALIDIIPTLKEILNKHS